MPLPPRPLPPTVQEALQRGNKIEAIKRLRQIEGIGLKEAKDAVEASGAGMLQALAPGEVPESKGWLWVAVLLALAAVLAWLLLR